MQSRLRHKILLFTQDEIADLIPTLVLDIGKLSLYVLIEGRKFSVFIFQSEHTAKIEKGALLYKMRAKFFGFWIILLYLREIQFKPLIYMKQKIIEALKTEFKQLGLSENTLGRLADYILGLDGVVKEEGDVATAVKRGDVALIAKSIQGEVDGIQKAKKKAEEDLADYKAKHPEKNDDDPKHDDDDDASLLDRIAAAVNAAVTPLTEKIAATEPLFLDMVPLTLEEIFIYELGGAEYAVKDLIL